MHSLNFQAIGFITSCYQEKFGIPRQPGLVSAAKSKLNLIDTFKEESIRGLEGFSHVWLQFVFHETQNQGWKPMVRPPRLGGNKKVGVFASRSTFRPNPIGLSVVKLDNIEVKKSGIVLDLLGCDLLDKTPVLDIKPYIPYVDSVSDAIGGFAHEKPEALIEVIFSDTAKIQCDVAKMRLGEDVGLVISQILALDPKPSYQQNQLDLDRIYRMKLYDFDLSWQYCENNKINVLAIN
ncbi:UNVERIFIED_CONTAM: hypothetical protein GTU68_016988 [Idotea baltica]|nr:hypothetical protein [Idotea baltica]